MRLRLPSTARLRTFTTTPRFLDYWFRLPHFLILQLCYTQVRFAPVTVLPHTHVHGSGCRFVTFLRSFLYFGSWIVHTRLRCVLRSATTLLRLHTRGYLPGFWFTVLRLRYGSCRVPPAFVRAVYARYRLRRRFTTVHVRTVTRLRLLHIAARCVAAHVGSRSGCGYYHRSTGCCWLHVYCGYGLRYGLPHSACHAVYVTHTLPHLPRILDTHTGYAPRAVGYGYATLHTVTHDATPLRILHGYTPLRALPRFTVRHHVPRSRYGSAVPRYTRTAPYTARYGCYACRLLRFTVPAYPRIAARCRLRVPAHAHTWVYTCGYICSRFYIRLV